MEDGIAQNRLVESRKKDREICTKRIEVLYNFHFEIRNL